MAAVLGGSGAWRIKGEAASGRRERSERRRTSERLRAWWPVLCGAVAGTANIGSIGISSGVWIFPKRNR